MTREIPLELIRYPAFRYLKLVGRQKFPVSDEAGWTENESLRYSSESPELRAHLNAGGNYGIICGIGGLRVIDIDDIDVIPEFEKILSNLGIATFVIETGSGGRHYYFFGDDNKTENYSQVGEYRGCRVYVVAPNSMHPNGNLYKTVSSAAIAELGIEQTNRIKGWLEEKSRQKIITKTKCITIKENASSAIKTDNIFVRRILPYWQGGDRQNLAMSLAGYLRKKGYGLKTANGIVTELCELTMDEETKSRLNAVEQTYDKDESEIKGLTGLEEIIPPEVLIEITNTASQQGSGKIILEYKTQHLPCFENLKGATQLFGREYPQFLKGMWYNLVGTRLRGSPIHYATVRQDTRMHIAVCLPSGRGKRNIKLTLKKITERLGYRVEAPTSLHPEQLVGKVIERKGKKKNPETKKDRTTTEYIPNKGYFDSDLLLIDEALELLRSKDLKIMESRQYICIATDPIGENEIKKRLVDHLEAEELRYCPKCSIVLFFQPLALNGEEVITKGLMRRLLTLYAVPATKAEEIYIKRLDSEDNSGRQVSEFVEFLKNTPDLVEWQFAPECKQTFVEMASGLLDIGQNFSAKGAAFTVILEQMLLEWLVKFSCILAGAYGHNEITPTHIKLAFMDLVELFLSNLQYVEEKVTGNVDCDGKGLNEKEKETLLWLEEQGATSLESSTIAIEQFVTKIRDIFGYPESSSGYKGSLAHKKYLNLQSRGFVQGEQVGQHSSRVWLIADLDEHLQSRVAGLQGLSLYNTIKEQLPDLVAQLQKRESGDLTSDTKLLDKPETLKPLNPNNEVFKMG